MKILISILIIMMLCTSCFPPEDRKIQQKRDIDRATYPYVEMVFEGRKYIVVNMGRWTGYIDITGKVLKDDR